MNGERLLKLRKEAELTQDELAATLSVNKHSISSYERSKSEPPDDLKIAIAQFFGVSVDYLLGVTDQPTPYKEQERCVRFPTPLTDAEREAVLEYAAYLVYKRNRDK